MTKIKNTKKGMAKKTLSISLAVAMLATSNVPVWAAEFTDGSDAAFTSEAVVETPVEEVVEAPVAEVAANYTLDTNMELASGTWNENVRLVKKDGVTDAAKFDLYKNGVPVNTVKYEVYYNDDLVSGKQILDISKGLMPQAPGLDVYLSGKKVTVKFYAADDNDVAATFETTLKAVDLKDATIDYTTAYVSYNGKNQGPKSKKTSGVDTDLEVTLNGSTLAEDAYMVKFVEDEFAVNYKKDGYTFYVEGVEERGYVGTSKATGTFIIGRVDANKDNLSVVISGETTYNGMNTKPTVVVTDKLSGKVIPSELYSVELDSNNAGQYTSDKVTVKMIEFAKVGTDTKETYNNFKAQTVADECVTGSFKINVLELNKLGEAYDIQVKPQAVGTVGKTLDLDKDVVFTEKSTGKIVKASAVLPVDELNAVLIDNAAVGTGQLVITAKAGATYQNIKGQYTAKVVVADTILTEDEVALPAKTKIGDVELTKRTALSDWVWVGNGYKTLKELITDELNKAEYTGSAVEPMKDVLEKLVWIKDVPDAADKELDFKVGTDYTLTYTDNKESNRVNKNGAHIKIAFQGKYVGNINFDFEVQPAEAKVTGENITFVSGKNSYDANVKVVTGTGKDEKAVPTSEYIVKTTQKARKIGDIALADVVFTNPNYVISGENNFNADNCAYKYKVESKLVGKSLTDETVTAVVEGTYTYTGKEMTPTLLVKDGDATLVLDKDYKVVAKHGIEAGDAYVTIEGIGNYSGRKVIKYTIEKADLATATVLNKAGKTNYDVSYTGLAEKPDAETVKIGDTKLKPYNPVTKEGDYELTWNLDAVEVGTYEFTITAVASSKKVQGTFKGTYKVVPAKLVASFAKKTGLVKYNKGHQLTATDTGVVYSGKAFTLADLKTKVVLVDEQNNVLVEGKDYRLAYENNVDAGVASVRAYGLGNYAHKDDKGNEVAITSLKFEIAAKGTIDSTWIRKINDVEYAGGLPVEPEVVVADEKNNRLVQGVDYEVVTTVKDINNYNGRDITIVGKGAYVASDIYNDGVKGLDKLTWKVTKKDMKNTTVTVDKNDNVIVMNGTVVVPSTEYTVAFSADGSKVTVTAKEDSKHYTGSKEQDVDVAKVGKAMIKEVKVVGNKATVILSDKVENAEGYDFVIATEADYKNGRVDITKNQLKTSGDFTYVQKGVYYAYCHAWKRDENNKKVFGDWSNLFQFTVSATTPETPVITSVKRSGKNVTVTYKNAKNAEGYDIVLGSKRMKVNGELRPVEYGKLVQKNKTTTTVTFKNVPKGRYYVGMHAYNRSSVDNKKVFSRWENWSGSVTVK